MSWWNRARPKLLGTFVWCLARMVGRTLRFRIEGKENYEAVLKTGAVIVSWHGRTFIPANYFAHDGWWAIISLSRDGEIQNRIFSLFGFRTVRGSTGRGGVRAALEAAKRVREGGILALTPDGPRGPHHSFTEGTLFIARKSGRPVIPAGISASPRKFLPTWDSYLIPFPFARAAIVFGEPIAIPEGLTPEDEHKLVERLTAEIDRLEARAEELVGGRRYVTADREA